MASVVVELGEDPLAFRELHVEINYEDGGYWAEVRELPGCFATGRTLGELTEALEGNVALYLSPSAEDEDGVEAEPEALEGLDRGGGEVDLEAEDLDFDDGDGVDEVEGVVGVASVKLHIKEMVVCVAAERPLSLDVRTDEPLQRPPRHRDPHRRWLFRDFHRRGEEERPGPDE